ncbi:MAG: peptidoglycan DD-metalloendopeptidase family protein [Hyphomicrobiales bacterium]|nr:peptidoglycan DD-metalloendopeptidase family protein [Hyphomicrobiales bacterium]
MACSQRPATVEYRGTSASRVAVIPAKKPGHNFAKSSKPAKVKTVTQVAKTQPLPLPDLTKTPFYKVKVQKGDTVHAIAKKHHITSRDIARANGLRKPYAIKVGQVLKVPAFRYHRVEPGDSVSELAETYDSTTKVIAKANNMGKPHALAVGQWLIIPAVPDEKPQTAVAAVRKSTEVAAIVKPIAKPSIKSTPKAAKRNFSRKSRISSSRDGRVEVASLTNIGIATTPVIKASTGNGQLGWPVLRGKVISKFGPQKKGIHNDGINIQAKAGAKILAAEDGEVVYVGEGLKGYGNMLIIKHDSGYLTAYAHNQKILVKKRQRVKRGQLIGYVGATGNVSTPQLHFAVRKGKQAVDPLKYLSS